MGYGTASAIDSPNEMTHDDPDVLYLIDRRFPDADEVRCQYNPEVYGYSSDYENRLRQLDRYERELSLLSPVALHLLAETERKREELERFYNQPCVDADFSHWSKVACWSLDEAVALCFNKCPKKVSWQTLAPYKETSPFVFRYDQLKDLLERAKFERPAPSGPPPKLV